MKDPSTGWNPRVAFWSYKGPSTTTPTGSNPGGVGIVQDNLRAVVPPSAGGLDGWMLQHLEATRFMYLREDEARCDGRVTHLDEDVVERVPWVAEEVAAEEEETGCPMDREVKKKSQETSFDEMMDAIREAEPALRGDGIKWREAGRTFEVDVEWGSALILARRR
ncbi:hypothetical protein VTN00DRAFT_3423 [Thermoascus crustaceus]|uniref:uncharacterized protein n=1 Tax=Thermoascus crustaceus TaxID=5088 RepID=UPI003742BDFF